MTMRETGRLARRFLLALGVVGGAVLGTVGAFAWLRVEDARRQQAAIQALASESTVQSLRASLASIETALVSAAAVPAEQRCDALDHEHGTGAEAAVALVLLDDDGAPRCMAGPAPDAAMLDALRRMDVARGAFATTLLGGATVTVAHRPRRSGGLLVALADGRALLGPALPSLPGVEAMLCASRHCGGDARHVADALSVGIRMPDAVRDGLDGAMLRLGVVLAVLLLGLAAMALLWRRSIARPIERLQEAIASQDDAALRAFLDDPDEPLRPLALAVATTRMRLRRRLALRDLLLREMSHRLRNNLGVVASLLRLQARQVADRTARSALEAAEERIRTLALVQHDLQEATRGARPALGEFAWRIVERHIAGSEDLSARIAVRWAGDSFRLAPEQVMAVGLIVNEWAAVTLRGPLSGCVEGSIHLRVRGEAGGATLIWADNGDDESCERHALSHAIVDGLVRQIGGELARAEAGLRWKLFVPQPEERPGRH